MRELKWSRGNWNDVIDYVAYTKSGAYQVRRCKSGWSVLPATATRPLTDFDRELTYTGFKTLRDAKRACQRHALITFAT